MAWIWWLDLDARLELFKYPKVYDHPGSDELFAEAMSAAVAYHSRHCPEYAQILELAGFDAERSISIVEIDTIPPIPTLFLKQHELNSMPVDKMILRSTTSGTSGRPVSVGMDKACLRLGANMLLRIVRHHELLSFRPTRHVILGYQPSSHNHMGAVRTAYGSTWLALPISRAYALRDTGDGYELNIAALLGLLERYSQSKTAVRISGFPTFLLELIRQIQAKGTSLKMPPHSKVLLGGGWKLATAESVDKGTLYRLVETCLGIQEKDIVALFGVVEHPIPYFSCPRHHFHVPVYSRVLIRDPLTLRVLPFGEPGLLNLISPFLYSMPLVSIMTDDVATLYPGASCGCGNEAPWFEVLGRAGLKGIQTCSLKAEELL